MKRASLVPHVTLFLLCIAIDRIASSKGHELRADHLYFLRILSVDLLLFWRGGEFGVSLRSHKDKTPRAAPPERPFVIPTVVNSAEANILYP